MRIARFSVEDQVSFGVIDEFDSVHELAGHPFAAQQQVTGRTFSLDRVRLLAPFLPSKVIAVGKNYADHAAEMGGGVPDEPMIFLKPSTSVIGPGEVIALPAQSGQVEHEAELAVVIGRLCREVPIDRAADVILGYTCANDVTARDLQARDGQWGRAKGFDTFCPLGPWIRTDLDLASAEPESLAITCEVNGDPRQLGSTAQLVRPVAELIAFISSVMTLLPGDVILTGTPAGVGPLRSGDVVDVSIEGIGSLTNKVGIRD